MLIPRALQRRICGILTIDIAGAPCTLLRTFKKSLELARESGSSVETPLDRLAEAALMSCDLDEAERYATEMLQGSRVHSLGAQRPGAAWDGCDQAWEYS